MTMQRPHPCLGMKQAWSSKMVMVEGVSRDGHRNLRLRTLLLTLVKALHYLGKYDAESFCRRFGIVGKPASARPRVISRDERKVGFGLLRPCHERELPEVNPMAVDPTDISVRPLI